MGFTNPALERLSRRIEELRARLHALLEHKEEGKEELLKLSQELDQVILEFQRLAEGSG